MTHADEFEQADVDSERFVYALLAILPSESTIHLFVYTSLSFLTLLFVVGTPAVALLFAEHHPVSGAVFVGVNVAVFCASFVVEVQRRLGVPKPGRLQLVVASSVRWMRKTPLLSVIASKITLGSPHTFQAYPQASRPSRFIDFYKECWRSIMGAGSIQPVLYWNYRDREARAQVAGNSREPIVAISAGLVSLFPGRADVARVYLLHEFGHIFNQDLEVFACTIAGSLACRTVIFVSTGLSALILLPYFHGTILDALILLVEMMWLLLMIVLWILLARYAGVIISLRELYADVQAVIWLPGIEAYRAVLLDPNRLPLRDMWQRIRSLVTVNLIHLSPAERLSRLESPSSLLYPRNRYYILVALLLIALQSNPFGEGYDNNWMRWSFLLACSPVCFAYLMNVGRAVIAQSFLPRGITPRSFARLWLGVSIVLLLPMLTLHGIYGDIVLSLSKWSSLWGSMIDCAKTLEGQWLNAEWLCVPALSFVWLSLTCRLARTRLQNLSVPAAKGQVSRYNASFLAVALVAVLVETIFLGVREYGSVTPTFLDSFQVRLETFGPSAPVASLGVLIAGSWRIWKSTTQTGQTTRTHLGNDEGPQRAKTGS